MLKIIKNTLLIIALVLCFSACGSNQDQCDDGFINGANGTTAREYWKCDDYFETLQFLESRIGVYTPYLDVENPRKSRLFKWEQTECGQIRFSVYRDPESFEGEGSFTLLGLEGDRLAIEFQSQGLSFQTECKRIGF